MSALSSTRESEGGLLFQVVGLIVNVAFKTRKKNCMPIVLRAVLNIAL